MSNPTDILVEALERAVTQAQRLARGDIERNLRHPDEWPHSLPCSRCCPGYGGGATDGRAVGAVQGQLRPPHAGRCGDASEDRTLRQVRPLPSKRTASGCPATVGKGGTCNCAQPLEGWRLACPQWSQCHHTFDGYTAADVLERVRAHAASRHAASPLQQRHPREPEVGASAADRCVRELRVPTHRGIILRACEGCGRRVRDVRGSRSLERSVPRCISR